MSKKVLVIVDMQNDFITGTLKNKEAEKLLPKMYKFINDFSGHVIFTQDTHDENYLDTFEGKNLPIKHCIKNTDGWEVEEGIEVISFATNMPKTIKPIGFDFKVNRDNKKTVQFIEKNTFGSLDTLQDAINEDIKDLEEIIFCGVCTDICVVSNALITRAKFPNIKITVMKDLCAGTSKETHEAALTVMKSCQIDIE